MYKNYYAISYACNVHNYFISKTSILYETSNIHFYWIFFENLQISFTIDFILPEVYLFPNL